MMKAKTPAQRAADLMKEIYDLEFTVSPEDVLNGTHAIDYVPKSIINALEKKWKNQAPEIQTQLSRAGRGSNRERENKRIWTFDQMKKAYMKYGGRAWLSLLNTCDLIEYQILKVITLNLIVMLNTIS